MADHCRGQKTKDTHDEGQGSRNRTTQIASTLQFATSGLTLHILVKTQEVQSQVTGQGQNGSRHDDVTKRQEYYEGSKRRTTKLSAESKQVREDFSQGQDSEASNVLS